LTILAGVSWSGQSSAPLNLAAQISRNTGDKNQRHRDRRAALAAEK
jgi:hypothetical protein